MFSEYKYLIVNLAFSHLGFWSGDFFLIAPFPERPLFVPFWYLFEVYGVSGRFIRNQQHKMTSSKYQRYLIAKTLLIDINHSIVNCYYIIYYSNTTLSSCPFNVMETSPFANIQ